MTKIPGDYIAGFVDGEGCFALKFRRDVRRERISAPTYFYWDIEFIIALRNDDREILEKIRDTIGCGTVRVTQKEARYTVNALENLQNMVVPFFEKFPLRAKKRHDFELWKEALSLLNKNKGKKTGISSTGNRRGARKETWAPNELGRVKEIIEAMRPYKSKRTELRWLKEVHL